MTIGQKLRAIWAILRGRSVIVNCVFPHNFDVELPNGGVIFHNWILNEHKATARKICDPIVKER